MRKKFNEQLPLMNSTVKHALAEEYKAVDQILNENSFIYDLAHMDLTDTVKMANAGTGFRDVSARQAGFDPLIVDTECWDHKVYYPGAQKMRIRLTGDKGIHRILGAQIMGHVSFEVSKRVDVVATAIYNELKVEELSDIDLSYTPPLSSP